MPAPSKEDVEEPGSSPALRRADYWQLPAETLQTPEQQSKSVVQNEFGGPQQLHDVCPGTCLHCAVVPSGRMHGWPHGSACPEHGSQGAGQ